MAPLFGSRWMLCVGCFALECWMLCVGFPTFQLSNLTTLQLYYLHVRVDLLFKYGLWSGADLLVDYLAVLNEKHTWN